MKYLLTTGLLFSLMTFSYGQYKAEDLVGQWEASGYINGVQYNILMTYSPNLYMSHRTTVGNQVMTGNPEKLHYNNGIVGTPPCVGRIDWVNYNHYKFTYIDCGSENGNVVDYYRVDLYKEYLDEGVQQSKETAECYRATFGCCGADGKVTCSTCGGTGYYNGVRCYSNCYLGQVDCPTPQRCKTACRN